MDEIQKRLVFLTNHINKFNLKMAKSISLIPHYKYPFSAEMISQTKNKVSESQLIKGMLYWTASIAEENGRIGLFCLGDDQKPCSLLPPPFSLRSRINGYGGATFWAIGDQIVWVNDADQNLYQISQNQNIQQITLTPLTTTYTDLFPIYDYHALAVKESLDSPFPKSEIIVINLESGEEQLLFAGADYYSNPTFCPQRKKISWLQWSFKAMPWQSSTVWVADFLFDGTASFHKENPRCLAGGEGESVFQPSWSPDGSLTIVSDRSGYWNLWQLRQKWQPLFPCEAEFGLPQWIYGMRTYQWISPKELAFSALQENSFCFGRLSLDSGKVVHQSHKFANLDWFSADSQRYAFVGATEKNVPKIIYGNWGEDPQKISQPILITIPDEKLSLPICIKCEYQDLIVDGFYYPPNSNIKISKNKIVTPLIISCHSGPTSREGKELDLRKQFFTSRGFAWLSVNYRGSTGKGRVFREALNGHYGIADLSDTLALAEKLCQTYPVDPNYWFIRGSSSGGYTALQGLVTTKRFLGGASYYGISDLESLVSKTHKFEAYYFDSLIGPYPEYKEKYRQRSPLHNLKNAQTPVILFQGGKDAVVPPSQSEAIHQALLARGIPSQYYLFPEEGHGFRHPTTIQKTLEKEYQFYINLLLSTIKSG